MANQRQTIVTALTKLLKTLPASIQIGVYDRRDIVNEPFTPDELPAINIMDGKGEIEKLTVIDLHTMPVEITQFRAGVITPATVRGHNSTIAALIDANYTLYGTATSIIITSDEIINEQYGDSVITGNLSGTVTYRTAPGQL